MNALIREVIDLDQETRTRYRLDVELGQGATSTIYKGVDLSNPTARPVAVKVGRLGVVPELMQAFWYELELLQKLESLKKPDGTAACRQVPWAHRGEAVGSQHPIIIMELVPAEFQLSVLAAKTAGKLSPELGLEAARQYAELLTALGQLGVTSRGDRKATDLRWDEAEKRLIVLDWNRAQPICADAPADRKAELIRQELRVFAALWSELLLGQRLSPLPPVDDTSQLEWAFLLRGWRVILSEAAGSRAGFGYQSGEELLHACTWLAQAQGMTPDRRLEMAETLRREAEQTDDAQLKGRNAESILTLAALSADDDGRWADLRQWAARNRDPLLSEALGVAIQIQTLLQTRQWARGNEKAAQFLARLAGLPIQVSQRRAWLTVERWQLVACFAQEYTAARRDPLEPAKRAMDAVVQLQSLDAGLQPAMAQRIAAVAQGMTGSLVTDVEVSDMSVTARDLAHALDDEAHLRLTLATIQIAGADAAQADAKAQWHDALRLWRNVDKVDPVYASNLRAVLPLLDARLAEEAHGEEEAQRIEEQLAKVDQIVDSVLAVLKDTREARWPDITEKLTEARIALAAARRGISAPSQRLDHTAALVSALDTVDQAMRDNDVQCAIAATSSVPDDPSTRSAAPGGLTSMLCKRVMQDTHLRLAQFSDRQMHWVDEVDDWLRRAQAVLEVEKSSEVQLERVPGEIERYARELQVWRDKRSQLWEQLRLSPQQPAAELANSFVDSTFEEIDQVLQEAHRARIELFDRRGVAAADIESLTVSSLVNRRRTDALKRRATELLGEVRGLAEELTKIAEAIQSQPELPLTMQQLVDLLDRRRVVHEQLACEDLQQLGEDADKKRKQLDALVQNLQSALGQLPEVRNNISQLEASTSDLQQRLQQVTDLSENADRLLAYVQKQKVGPVHDNNAELQQLIEEARKHDQELAGFETRLQRARKALAEMGQSVQADNSSLDLLLAVALHQARSLDRMGFADTYALIKKVRPREGLSGVQHFVQQQLEETQEWLEQVSTPVLLQEFRSWRRALQNGNATAAEEARQRVFKEFSLPSLQDHWIISDMARETQLLKDASTSRTNDQAAESHQLSNPVVGKAGGSRVSEVLPKIATENNGWRMLLLLCQTGINFPSLSSAIRSTEDLLANAPEGLADNGWTTMKDFVNQMLSRLEDSKQADIPVEDYKRKLRSLSERLGQRASITSASGGRST